MAQVIAIAGVALAAMLTYVVERKKQLRHERIQVATEFAQALESYRSSLKHRRHDNMGRDGEGTETNRLKEKPELVEAVRVARTAAWGAYYTVVLLVGDKKPARLGRHALDAVKRIDTARTHEEADELSDAARAASHDFVCEAGAMLGIKSKTGGLLRGSSDSDVVGARPRSR